MKRSKKFSAILCCMALLLGCVGGLGLFGGAAATAERTPITSLDQLPEGASLIAGKVPMSGTATLSEGSFDQLTDGKVQALNQTVKFTLSDTVSKDDNYYYLIASDAMVAEYGLDTSKTWYIRQLWNQPWLLTDVSSTRASFQAASAKPVYDLGAVCDVEQLFIASTAELKGKSGGNPNTIANVKITDDEYRQYSEIIKDKRLVWTAKVYVGDTPDVFQSEKLVLEYDLSGDPADAFRNLWTLPEAKQGRYVGFDFSDAVYSGFVRVSELGVYGAVVPGQPVRTPVTSVDQLPEGASLIAGKTPLVRQNGEAIPLQSGAFNQLTDGQIQGLNQPIRFTLTADATVKEGDKTYYNWIAPAELVAEWGEDTSKTWYMKPQNVHWLDSNTVTTRAVFWESTAQPVYDLGGVFKIDQVLLASSIEMKGRDNYVDTPPNRALTYAEVQGFSTPNLDDRLLYKAKVYVSRDKETIFDEENLALEYDLSGNYADALRNLWTLGEAVEGRYVAFDFTGGAKGGLVRVSELAVYGAAASGRLVRTPVTSVDQLPEGASLIAGKTPLLRENGEAIPLQSGAFNQLTDGQIQGLNQPIRFTLTTEATVKEGDKTYYNWIAPAELVAEWGEDTSKTWYMKPQNVHWLDSNTVTTRAVVWESTAKPVYDLGGVFKIDQVLLASSIEMKGRDNYVDTPPNRALTYEEVQGFSTPNLDDRLLYKAKVYVSRDKATIFDEENLALEYDLSGNYADALRNLWTLGEAVEGRYVAFDFTGGAKGGLVRISELAVYGELVEELFNPRTPVLSESDLPQDDNLLWGRTPTMADGSPVNVASGNLDMMVDGGIHGINQDVLFQLSDQEKDKTAVYNGKTYYSYIASPSMVAAQGLDSSKTWYVVPANGVWMSSTGSATRTSLAAATAKPVYDLGRSRNIRQILLASVVELRGLTNNNTQSHHTITDAQAEEIQKPLLDKRLLWTAKVYVGNDKATIFDEANLVLEYDLSANCADALCNLWTLEEAAEGQYVGFDFSAADYSGQVRISELGVYGDEPDTVKLPVTALNSQAEYNTAVSGKTNLLLGEAVEGKKTNYLVHSASTVCEGEAAFLTDGYVNWNAEDEVKKVAMGDMKYNAVSMTYDLRGLASIDGILMANSSCESAETRIPLVKVYAGDDPDKLYEEDNLVGIAQTDPANTGYYISLAGLNVTTRYIGLRFPSSWSAPFYGLARLTELGVYGTYENVGSIRHFLPNMLNGSDVRLIDDCQVSARGIDNKTAVDVNGNPGTGNTGALTGKAEPTSYEPLINLTDGDPDTRASQSVTGPKDGVYGGPLQYNTNWLLFSYYLGGEAKLDSISLASSNEPNYYISGVQYYASEKYEDLFKNESLLYTTGGEYFTQVDGELEADVSYDVRQRYHTYELTEEQRAKTYRYVAFVITRPYPFYFGDSTARLLGWNQVRVSELEAMGKIVKQEEPIISSFTASTSLGEATVSIAVKDKDLDNREFFDSIARVTIDEEAYPAGMNRNIEGNWLTVAHSKMLHVRFWDENGKQITVNDANRDVMLSLKTGADTTYAFGKLENGQIRRLYNAMTWLDGTTTAGSLEYPVYAEGIANHRDQATIQDLDFSLVLLKYNDLATYEKLNDIVDEDLETFLASQVAGAGAANRTTEAREGAYRWLLWSILPALMATLIFVFLRRRKAARQ